MELSNLMIKFASILEKGEEKSPSNIWTSLVGCFLKAAYVQAQGGFVFKQINERYASILGQYVKFSVEKSTKELYDAKICT